MTNTKGWTVGREAGRSTASTGSEDLLVVNVRVALEW